MMIQTKFSSKEIEQFWHENPCGQDFVERNQWKSFYSDYDEYKYRIEPHIPVELSKIDFSGKRVLEIGLGQGAEAQKMIEAGAIYNGIDLTGESVHRLKRRFELFGLPYESVQKCNAEKICFPDNSFDIVFSHGVIHHSPRIAEIVSEIHRVLKPGGQLVLMLYHRHSLNYHLFIKLIRRIGIFLLFVPGFAGFVSKATGEPLNRLLKHRDYLKRDGLFYLRMKNFIHKSTDGPDNVYSSVYSISEAKELLEEFKQLNFSIHLLNERHLFGLQHFLPNGFKKKLESRFGWHLWIKGRK